MGIEPRPRIALLWHGVTESELQGVVGCARRALAGSEDFGGVELMASVPTSVAVPEGVLRLAEGSSDPRDYPLALEKAVAQASALGVDFLVASVGPAWFLKGGALRALLARPEVASHPVSVRAGSITGEGLNFSPKLPFVDSAFVVIHVPLSCKAGIFSNGKWPGTHFYEWGREHAVFFSWLEAQVPEGGVFAYSDGSELVDEYGESRGFGVTGLRWSERDGLLCPGGRTLDAGAAQALQRILESERLELRMPILRRSVLERGIRGAMAQAKHLMNRFNYELRKSYGADRS